MKSLNKSAELWTNMSAKEIENSNYAGQCCFNIKVNSAIQTDQDQSKQERVESK